MMDAYLSALHSRNQNVNEFFGKPEILAIFSKDAAFTEEVKSFILLSGAANTAARDYLVMFRSTNLILMFKN
jgi:hypothetical protein